MASRWDRLKGWLGSKPSAEELAKARTPTHAEANQLDQGAVDASNALLKDSVRYSPAGLVYDYMTADPEAEAELARVRGNPVAGPASPTAEQAAQLEAERRLATNPLEGPELRQEVASGRKGKPAPRVAGGGGPAAPPPLRPEVKAYLEKKFSAPKEERDTELEAAQADAAGRRMIANAGRAGATFSAAFADQAPGTYQGFWDEQAKGADQPGKDLQARRDAARAKKTERQGDEDRARALSLDDPSSEQSKLARELFTAQHPEQAKRFGERLQLFSASAITKLAPSIEKELDRAAQASEASKNRALQREIHAADNAADLEKARLGAGKGADKDQKKALFEIQDRHKNIKDQLAQLRQMVSTRGTNEFLGGHNKILEQKLTSVATDMAKLVDPNSVARESEVQTFKKMLFEPGLWQRDSSALEVLGSFEKMVDDRLGNAYAVRGLEAPRAPASGLNDQEEADYQRLAKKFGGS